MPGPVTDARAYELRERYHERFAGEELPVPVEAIASDLHGLYVEEDAIECSGPLIPAERCVVLNAAEPEPRAGSPDSAWRVGNPELATDRPGGSERNLAVTRNGDRTLGGGAAPDVVTGAASDALAAVVDQMPLELAQSRHE
jgi:hypothetical protein